MKLSEAQVANNAIRMLRVYATTKAPVVMEEQDCWGVTECIRRGWMEESFTAVPVWPFPIGCYRVTEAGTAALEARVARLEALRGGDAGDAGR